MTSNLEIFTEEYERLKGQFILVDNIALRFIGLVEDEEDYYYCLYDGRKLKLTTCVQMITPLKGFIYDNHYNEMVRMAKLNHYDQPTLYGIKDSEEVEKLNNSHKAELLENWDENTKFMCGPCWELN
jgi:hypothetical protein